MFSLESPPGLPSEIFFSEFFHWCLPGSLWRFLSKLLQGFFEDSFRLSFRNFFRDSISRDPVKDSFIDFPPVFFMNYSRCYLRVPHEIFFYWFLKGSFQGFRGSSRSSSRDSLIDSPHDSFGYSSYDCTRDFFLGWILPDNFSGIGFLRRFLHVGVRGFFDTISRHVLWENLLQETAECQKLVNNM